MRLPQPLGFDTFRAIEVWARTTIGAILTAWGVEHTDAGRHQFTSSPVAFVASDFYASGSMTWTVGAGDVITHRTARIGNWLAWTFEIAGSVVGGTASTNLRVKIPGGVLVQGRQCGTFKFLDAGTDGTGVWIATDGSDAVQLFTDYNLTAWTVGANTGVFGQLLLEVR